MTTLGAPYIEFPETVTRFAVAGDWHGDGRYAFKAIKRLAGRVDVVIHVGDFMSLYTPEPVLDDINKAAEVADLIVMFVDGNHERYDLLGATPVDEDGVRRLRPRVWHLPRGFRWEWLGVTFLALGGAHSVDRRYLNAGRTWWPEETITLRQAMEVTEAGHADVMITHDCPEGVAIPRLDETSSDFHPQELLYAQRHRYLLAQIVEEVRPRFLWHGHYHRHHESTYTYDDGKECQVVGLDDNRAQSYADNVQVVDVADLM